MAGYQADNLNRNIMRLSEKLYCIPILGIFIAVFCFSPQEHRKMDIRLLVKMGVVHIFAVEVLLFIILFLHHKP